MNEEDGSRKTGLQIERVDVVSPFHSTPLASLSRVPNFS